MLFSGVSVYGFFFGGLGWSRKTFSGLTSRVRLVGGAGNRWVETDELSFQTDVGLTYNAQDDVIDDPTSSDTFGGFRATTDLGWKVSENTTFRSVLVLDENLADTDDLRLDVINSLSVAINSTLALKTSLQLRYDNQPSLAGIPLFDTNDNPLGTDVLAELDQLDTIFTATLVINF